MKKADIEVGKVYAYQRNRNDSDSTWGIEPATVTGFTTSYGGAPMVEVKIPAITWEYSYDDKFNRIPESQRRVEYNKLEKVPLATIVGDYQAEKARREALYEARKIRQAHEEAERALRAEWKSASYDPAFKTFAILLQEISGSQYLRENTKLGDFSLEQIKVITKALESSRVIA